MQKNERNEPALGFVRNDGRITRPASCVQDEGIVQPVSKEMDQLSRRLHHHTPPGRPGGVFFSLFFTILKLMGCYRCVLSLDPRDAAYIAGLIDGEGTITLSRELHRLEAYDETSPGIHYPGFGDGVEFAGTALSCEAIAGACSISGWVCVCFLAWARRVLASAGSALQLRWSLAAPRRRSPAQVVVQRPARSAGR